MSRRSTCHLVPVLVLLLAHALQAADPQYEIGPGDVLQVVVLDQPAFSGEFPVAADGFITYPFIGKVKGAGMSGPALERKLSTLLADGYLRRPNVSVTVKKYSSQRIFVTGEIAHPGVYGLRPDRKLSSLLQDLGDLGTNVGHEVLVIRPPGPRTAQQSGDPDTEEWDALASTLPQPAASDAPLLPGEVPGAEVFRINLREVRSGFPGRDLELKIGDTVYFPKAAHVYVTGFVARPGMFPYEEGLTVYKLLNLAGGVTDRGSEKGTRIVRLVEGRRTTLKPKLTDVLLPEDTVHVPERFF